MLFVVDNPHCTARELFARSEGIEPPSMVLSKHVVPVSCFIVKLTAHIRQKGPLKESLCLIVKLINYYNLSKAPLCFSAIIAVCSSQHWSLDICEVLPSDVRHPMKLLLRNYCASSTLFSASPLPSFAVSEFIVSTSVSGRL